MKNIVKKLLVTTAAFIVMSGSLGVGTLRVLAEQYYGWNDGTGSYSPFNLYVTPVNESKRREEKIVYCFNKTLHWPDIWESHVERPSKLTLYNREDGSETLFRSKSTKARLKDKNIIAALVAVLENGYPNKKVHGLSDKSNRKVTQLAIWYFSDSSEKINLENDYSLQDAEKKLLSDLIEKGEKASESDQYSGQTLDLYTYVSGGEDYSDGKPYQNLLGSTLIPKKEVPKEPRQPEPKEPEKPKTPEEPKPTPKPEIPKKEDLGIVIGGGNVVETEEILSGEQGQSGSTTEVEDTKGSDVIVGGQGQIVETEESLSGEQGQSGSTTEVEDTKGPDVIIGGQDQIVETEESLSGEQGQSGSTTEVEDTKSPDVMIGGQGEIVDFEETLPTEQGQSGSTTEVEDTKGADVMIGGQGEIVDFEETLPTEQGQSGSTTEAEDTKGADVMIGGQGEIVEFEETLPTEHGQSGSTTEVEDSKPKISIHFDNEWPKEEKPQLPTVEKPKAKVSLPATGEAEHVLSTIVGAMILFLVSLWGLLKRKASKA
ncbi:thioester-forming surface-anchored protein [Streptococcus dysgalactiae]|uniref:thioester-forming surface-anchored protein n=1 Tax=Streptococcus dysgalactiae TaxID=1334 RepID=UPI0018661333|nr:thioester-forming surface-anchored protein [Streptococcus dysgalactiae]